MLKNIDFSFNFPNSKKFSKKLKINKLHTDQNFNTLKKEYFSQDSEILDSFTKNFSLNFSEKMVNKFKKFHNIVVVGMGGSILGLKAIDSFLKLKIKKKVFFLDNLDEKLHLSLSKLNQNNTCIITISKSGNTLETILNFNYIKKLINNNNLIIICEKKNNLIYNLAKKHKVEVVEHNQKIGGRFSIFSEVGMLPSAIIGLEINNFKNNRFFYDNKYKNILIKSVAFLTTLYNFGYKNHISLHYHSDLIDLCYWHQQLLGESLGKNRKGFMPIVSLAPRDHHSLMQLYLDGPGNEVFTILSNKKKSKIKSSNFFLPKEFSKLKKKDYNFIIEAQCLAAKRVFTKKNIPFRSIVINKQTEKEIGELFIFFIMETILISKLMKVNPFDQPAVEQIKKETKKIIL